MRRLTSLEPREKDPNCAQVPLKILSKQVERKVKKSHQGLIWRLVNNRGR